MWEYILFPLPSVRHVQRILGNSKVYWKLVVDGKGIRWALTGRKLGTGSSTSHQQLISNVCPCKSEKGHEKAVSA